MIVCNANGGSKLKQRITDQHREEGRAQNAQIWVIMLAHRCACVRGAAAAAPAVTAAAAAAAARPLTLRSASIRFVVVVRDLAEKHRRVLGVLLRMLQVEALGRALGAAHVAADRLIARVLPCAEIFSDSGHAAGALECIPVVAEAVLASRVAL